MRMMHIYLCLLYNRTKQDSKNYKTEWKISGTHRKRNRYYSHGHTSQEKTIRTGYAVNTQFVLQITDKQREKLTGSSSDSSSDRISLSRTPKNRWPQWV